MAEFRVAPLRLGWAAAWPGLILATALLLPFLRKAHAVDDVTFLLQAEHALKDPWHPTAFDMVADGERIRLSSRLVTGPLMAWLLLPCAALNGSEWAAHLVQWALVCVTVLSVARLGLRFGLTVPSSRFAALLVASCPAVVGMATTSMSDVPAMAFAALGMERFVAWADERRALQGVAAALSLACAALARSHALALPLVATLALRREPGTPRRGVIDVLPLLAAPALAWATLLATADPVAARGSVLDALWTRGASPYWPRNVAGFGCHWLVAVPLALPWLLVRARRLVRDVFAWLVLVAASSFLVWLPDPRMNPVLAVATALAYVALVDVIRDAWRRGDRVQMLLGAWLLPALLATPYEQLPCKYLLVSVPAAALLVARAMEREEDRLMWPVVGALVAAGSALGVLIVLADAEFTDAGRRAAREFVAPKVLAGEHVRYAGAWGAQWYAMHAGADVIARGDPAPAPGEVVVVSALTPGATPAGTSHVEVLGELDVLSHFGRVMSPQDGSGFYSNGCGYLPWSWRNGPIERVVCVRVR